MSWRRRSRCRRSASDLRRAMLSYFLFITRCPSLLIQTTALIRHRTASFRGSVRGGGRGRGPVSRVPLKPLPAEDSPVDRGSWPYETVQPLPETPDHCLRNPELTPSRWNSGALGKLLSIVACVQSAEFQAASASISLNHTSFDHESCHRRADLANSVVLSITCTTLVHTQSVETQVHAGGGEDTGTRASPSATACAELTRARIVVLAECSTFRLYGTHKDHPATCDLDSSPIVARARESPTTTYTAFLSSRACQPLSSLQVSSHGDWRRSKKRESSVIIRWTFQFTNKGKWARKRTQRDDASWQSDAGTNLVDLIGKS